MKQLAINLVSGVSCTIRANDGVHCTYNILDAPPKYRQTAILTICRQNQNSATRSDAVIAMMEIMEQINSESTPTSPV